MRSDCFFHPGSLLIAFLSCLMLGCAGPSAIDNPMAGVHVSAAQFADTCDAWDEWDKPAPPFRVYGGTYHVGTCGITAILITTPDGHLVIDSGTSWGGAVVAANIVALGFDLAEVRYLTHTQEHWDHVGGMAYLRSQTGASMIASERAASVFETGIINADDPQFALQQEPMATLSVDRLVMDGEAIELGDKQIVARLTPGHSPGAISWRWRECENNECLSLVFTDGMGPVSADDYRWTDHPGFLADYRESVSWLETVDADICLAAHPSQMRLIERINGAALVDRDACRRAADSLRSRIDAIVEAELQ